MTGVQGRSYTFSVNNISNGWKEVFSCWSNCGNKQSVPGLAAGSYSVKIYLNGVVACNTTIVLEPITTNRSLSSDVLYKNQISIYPNPVKNEFWVRLGQLSDKKVTPIAIGIRIFNAWGQLMYQNLLEAGNLELRLESGDYQNGIYYLLLETEKSKIISKSFVVEHYQ